MKLKKLVISLAAAAVIFTGCSSKPADNNAGDKTPETDVVTSASVVTDEASLVKALGEDGTWIVILKNDFTAKEELVLEGEVKKDGAAEYAGRKIALYDQDDNRNITASYTLTAPSLTIKSATTTIKGGTVVGDIYVEANNFTLDKAKVEGNIYFANEEAQSTFTANESEVTGVTEVK